MNKQKASLLFLLIAFFTLITAPLMVHSGRTDASAEKTQAADHKEGIFTRGIDQAIESRGKDLNQATTAPKSVPPVVKDSLPLTGKTIVVDAGHGGHDPGARRRLAAPKGKRGALIMEKNINLAIALSLAEKLRAQGATVVLTRSTDVFIPLEGRAAISNGIKADLFLSVHNNAHSNTKYDGIETYYHNADSKCPAEHIYNALVKGLPEQGNWVAKRRFKVVLLAQVPAVLAEIGYMTKASKLRLLRTAAYQEKAATALTQGVLDYFAATCPTVVPPPVAADSALLASSAAAVRGVANSETAK